MSATAALWAVIPDRSGSLRASLRAGLCFTRALIVYGLGARA